MFDHILVPTDFSEDAAEAASVAVAIAAKWGSRITLVHVVTPPTLMYEDLPSMDFVTPVEEAARTALAKELELLRVNWPSAESLFLRGSATQEILGAIDAQGADLVVMGKHGRGVLNRMLVGSVAERVVRHASVPVLTVKKPASISHATGRSSDRPPARSSRATRAGRPA